MLLQEFFRGKEGLDFGNRHAIIISHYCVADDVAGVKTLDGATEVLVGLLVARKEKVAAMKN